MTNMTKLVLATLCSALGTLPAYAHHSYAAFDQKICGAVEGVVKKWEFSYPHVWLWVTTKDSDGSDKLFGFEGSDPASLALYGWTPELLFKGDKVTVNYNPLRDGRNGGSVLSVVLPNGKRVEGQGTSVGIFMADDCVAYKTNAAGGPEEDGDGSGGPE